MWVVLKGLSDLTHEILFLELFFSWVVLIELSDLTHENLETFVIFSWVVLIDVSDLTHENLDDICNFFVSHSYRAVEFDSRKSWRQYFVVELYENCQEP